jgi:hypothetical protein
MKTFDLTAWIYARPIDAMDTPCIHANDNGHEEWQDWFHVKPFKTDSLFYRIDRPTLQRMAWEVICNDR